MTSKRHYNLDRVEVAKAIYETAVRMLYSLPYWDKDCKFRALFSLLFLFFPQIYESRRSLLFVNWCPAQLSFIPPNLGQFSWTFNRTSAFCISATTWMTSVWVILYSKKT